MTKPLRNQNPDLTSALRERLRAVVRRLTNEIVPAYADDTDVLEQMTEDELRQMVVRNVEGLSWPQRALPRQRPWTGNETLGLDRSLGRDARNVWRKQKMSKHDAPVPGRCNARTRNGGYCRSKPMHGKRRCRMHGGASTGPKTEAGKRRVKENLAKARSVINANTTKARTARSLRSRRAIQTRHRERVWPWAPYRLERAAIRAVAKYGLPDAD